MFAYVDKGGLVLIHVVNHHCVRLDLLVYLSVACIQSILNRVIYMPGHFNRKWHTRNYVLQVHCLNFALTIALLTTSFTSSFLKL